MSLETIQLEDYTVGRLYSWKTIQLEDYTVGRLNSLTVNVTGVLNSIAGCSDIEYITMQTK